MMFHDDWTTVVCIAPTAWLVHMLRLAVEDVFWITGHLVGRRAVLNKKLERRAAELLPNCLCLRDAEEVFGGKWDQRTNGRDHQQAAVAWGLFDGFHGRPCTHAGLLGTFEEDYKEAWEAGRRISSMEAVT